MKSDAVGSSASDGGNLAANTLKKDDKNMKKP